MSAAIDNFEQPVPDYAKAQAMPSGTELIVHLDGFEGPIDLLLSDVVMPDMGGPDLARQVQKQRPEIKVLWMSAYARDDLVRRGHLRPGSDVVLEKPFTRRTLATRLEQTLQRAIVA